MTVPAHLAVRRPQPRRSGLQRFGRALSWVATATSLLVVLGSLGGYAYVRYLDAGIHRVPVFTPDDPTRPAVGATGAVTVLLAGVDSRDGENAAYQGVGSEAVSGSRPDSLLLVHLSAAGDRVSVLSLPRDSYVTIPEHTENGQHHAAHLDKLNAAGDGGPALVVRTVEQLSGIRVDHYVQVDFAQFKAIVAALGGVDVCLTADAYDPKTGFRLARGEHTLSGDQALLFVRQRSGLIDDYSRIDRQQRFASSVIRKLGSSGVLLNPVRLNAFLTSASRSVTVDTGTDLDDLVALGEAFAAVPPADIAFASLPATDPGYRTATSGDVLLLDAARATDVFQRIHDDRPLADPAPAAPAAAPSDAPAVTGVSTPAQTAQTADCGS